MLQSLNDITIPSIFFHLLSQNNCYYNVVKWRVEIIQKATLLLFCIAVQKISGVDKGKQMLIDKSLERTCPFFPDWTFIPQRAFCWFETADAFRMLICVWLQAAPWAIMNTATSVKIFSVSSHRCWSIHMVISLWIRLLQDHAKAVQSKDEWG